MKFGKTDSGNVEHVLKKAQDFEISLADVRKRSEKRAWWVAGVSTFVSLCLLGGLFYMLPLKEKVPYLVMADAYTGTATVARLNTNLQDTQITASEAINRSNVSHFVASRESFDNVLLNLRDWKTVYAMSSAGVAKEYQAWLERTNPNSPFNIYGDRASIRVKILSIVLLGGDPKNNITPKGATVRFQRFIFDKTNGSTRVLDNKIATIDFVYKSNLKMDDEYRVENPLGFQVLSYRVDSDGTTPAAPGAINASSEVVPAVNTVPAQPNGDPSVLQPADQNQPAVVAPTTPATAPATPAVKGAQ